MGALYGAIYARDIPQEEMEAAAKSIAKSHNYSIYVAPTIRGWSAVYPSLSGQDSGVSESLAKQLKGGVIHTIVHDDDIFAYFYYRDGKLLDKFNSNPDYFEPASKRTWSALQGKPQAFADILPDQEHVDALANLLERARSEEFLFAGDVLAEFAEIFGLPNALTSYEYLEQGETEMIEEWESFVHLESDASSMDNNSQEVAREKELKAHWKSEGALLVDRISTGPLIRMPTTSSAAVTPSAMSSTSVLQVEG